ncbi:MAG: cupin domain-containing protein [Chitinophagaceae bacterium]
MEKNSHAVTAAGPDQGQLLSVAGGSYRIVISGKETGGAYAVIDMLVPPGGGPGPHAHPAIQESFYVVAGEVEVKTSLQTYTAGKGSFINIPLGGIIHCFKNKSDKPAQLLCMVVPAGLEDFFLEIGQPATDRSFVPPPPMDAAALKKLTDIAEKHGQLLYPPDYLDNVPK